MYGAGGRICGVGTSPDIREIAKVGDDFADERDMDLSAIALQGINQAQAQLDAAVTGLASAGASPNSGGVDVVDVASQLVATNSAEILLQLNLSTLKTADQLQKNVIDLLA
jgi:hypothetical protein